MPVIRTDPAMTSTPAENDRPVNLANLLWRQPFPVSSGLGLDARLLGDCGDDLVERPLLSVVVPFFNEQECVANVLAELLNVPIDAEIVAVDDGSRDGTWALIARLAAENPHLRGLRLSENRGQSAAIYAGLRCACGRYCATMDGDGQNDPADFPAMIEKLREADVVVGYRATRKDTLSRRAASRVANRIRRLCLRDGVRDTGCSMKVFPRDAVELLVPFNGLHRYLAAIFTQAGLRVAEVPVNHRPRLEGRSKYTNWDRALRGVHDLVGVGWLLRRKIQFPPLESTASSREHWS